VAEEFFVEGRATTYVLATGTDPTPDGRWQAVADETAPFRTRILVVRPADPARFNGTAVLSWLNVTAGYELGTADDDELLSGYAWVGVSAQKVGIDGFPPGAAPYRGRQAPNPPLKHFDPARYGSLEHPGDPWSFDIFTRAAMAVAPARDRTVDPMGGLDVRRLVATGASQSGARLTTYVNAVHPLVEVFDGFLITIIGGRGSPLGANPVPAAATTTAARLGVPTRIRDDIDVPVMILNTECEALGMFPSRRDDDDRFRFWEVAGAPHVVAVVPAERPEGRIDNPLSYRPVAAAAHRHMHAWLSDGTPPPTQPRIRFRSEGTPDIERDAYGNAIGGIRLPELEAPVAEYHGRDETAEGLGALYGWARPFSAEEIRSLYPSAEAYLKTWLSAVDTLVATGALRPEDAEAYRSRGNEVAAGLPLS
jgi:hypothetical protein